MLSYLTRRLGGGLIVLMIVTFLGYALIGLMPGDPIDQMLAGNPDLTAQDVLRLKAIHGLDLPLMDRYWAWLSSALQGDFGYSRLYRQPVGDILMPRLGASLLLLGTALILSLCIAVPLGIVAAARSNGPVDHLVNLICYAGISVPPFWLSLMLIALVAVPIAWIPAGGMGDPDLSMLQRLPYMLLPVTALTLSAVGGFTRFLRGAMLEVLSEDFMRTAKAKGAGPYRRFVGHALRNALLPLITLIALSFGSLFSGTLIIETIFGWNGMGRMIFEATMGNDFNLALVALIVTTGFTLIANILADVVYAVLDPRIRLDGAAGGDEGAGS